MPRNVTWQMGQKHGLIAMGLGALLLTTGACAGEAPKPTSTVTEGQVRSNAEKAFDKLKQEEKSRAVDSGVVSY